MNNFETIEAAGVGVILCLQLYNFYKTNREISIYRNIFPAETEFEIITPELRPGAWEIHPRDLLRKLNEFVSPGGVSVDLIRKKGGGNAVTDKIVESLNTYLIRNRGAASDFHLIKDVVER